MKRLTYLFMTLIPALSFAQTQTQTLPLDLFYEGKVVLQNGDSIKGLIKYNLNDMLQVLHNHRTDAFSSQNVSRFEIYDQTDKRVRHFYSLPYSKDGQYKVPVFFELISKGKINVFSRERIEVRTSRGPGFHEPTRETVIINKYFLLNEDGTINSFSGKRNGWYEMMGNQAEKVHEYVRSNKLDFNQKYQLKRIIDYYNSFSTNQSIFSSAKASDFSLQR